MFKPVRMFVCIAIYFAAATAFAAGATGPRLSDPQFFALLDLNRPDMAAVKTAVAKSDWPAARHALAEHMRTRTTPNWSNETRAGRFRRDNAQYRAEDALDGKMHNYEAIFHLNADTAKVDQLRVDTENADGPNLALYAVGADSMKIVKDRTTPEVQGWMSTGSSYTGLRQVPTAIYSKSAKGKITMVYLLYPTPAGKKSPVRSVKLKKNSLTLEMTDGSKKVLNLKSKWRRRAGSNRRITDLQSVALPLGYVSPVVGPTIVWIDPSRVNQITSAA